MLKRNTNNMWYRMLESGASIDVIRDELRQGVHRPERLNLEKDGQDMFGGVGFLRYFFGDPYDKYYEPKDDKNPYLMDEDMLFYKGIGYKGYYLTLTKEKEKINDAYDDKMIQEWGAESIFYIPSLKSFDNLDELDEIYIRYIFTLKQSYFGDRFINGEELDNKSFYFVRDLERNNHALWNKLTDRYPILLKPEYNMKALRDAIQFSFDNYDYIVHDAYVERKPSEYRASKDILKNMPTE